MEDRTEAVSERMKLTVAKPFDHGEEFHNQENESKKLKLLPHSFILP